MTACSVSVMILVELAVPAAASGEIEMHIELNVNHLDRLTRANMRVAAKKASVDCDPLRPIYHIMPAAGACGDPNGPIFVNGTYHMFFQHAPEFEWGKPAEEWEEGEPGHPGIGWGHASSRDLVYWKQEPIALMPERGSYDPQFCASGCAVLDDDGAPTILYTAAEPQTICIARSQDSNLRWWLKDENNPILYEPDIENYAKGGFRDPFVWREDSTWRMIVCGAVRGVGGMVGCFTSQNLSDWEYAGPLAAGMGEHCVAWECPNFLRFGDKGVLIVSPLFDNLQNTDHAPRGPVSYAVGPYGGDCLFFPGEWKDLDIGGPNHFYASNCLRTPDGRWLLWAMNMGGGAPDHHWTTNLSLPRVLTLRADGRLGQEPPVELQQLRRTHWGAKNEAFAGAYRIGIESGSCEIIALIEVGDASLVGLDVRGSSDFAVRTRVGYDAANGKLFLDGHSAEFALLEDEEVLRLHAFVDRSLFEVFVNRRECGTVRPFYNIQHQAMRLFSEGGTARIRSIDVWQMGSIWERPARQ
jgi:beta-fructofuranosidase